MTGIAFQEGEIVLTQCEDNMEGIFRQILDGGTLSSTQSAEECLTVQHAIACRPLDMVGFRQVVGHDTVQQVGHLTEKVSHPVMVLLQSEYLLKLVEHQQRDGRFLFITQPETVPVQEFPECLLMTVLMGYQFLDATAR